MAEAGSPPRSRPEGSFWQNLRHDLNRRMVRRGWVIWYLIVERGLRGLLFIAGGLALAVFGRGNPLQVAEMLEEKLGLSSGQSVFHTVATYILDRFGTLSSNTVLALALGAVLYGTLETAEALGLILRRRWAEYLVVIATCGGIPIEIREVMTQLTHMSHTHVLSLTIRVSLLVINIVIVIYLVYRKRLFRFDETASEV